MRLQERREEFKRRQDLPKNAIGLCGSFEPRDRPRNREFDVHLEGNRPHTSKFSRSGTNWAFRIVGIKLEFLTPCF
jgi:hypothetical protein